MQPRPATSADIDMLARIHVQSWREAYPGLLPDAEIAARSFEDRQTIWTGIFELGHSRIWVIDGLGFAQFGPQREDPWHDAGYPEELYAMYLVRAGYGLGRPLMTAAFGSEGRPFTACVIDANARACRFYEKSGGVHLTTRNDVIGKTPTVERVYGWRSAPFVHDGEAASITDREAPHHGGLD